MLGYVFAYLISSSCEGPRRDDALDLVPPGAQCLLRQPLSHLQAGLEFPDGLVVSEAGVAGVLAEQGFLFERWFQGDSVSTFHKLRHNKPGSVIATVCCHQIGVYNGRLG